MNRWAMLWWVLLLLGPMIPVVIFYSVFSDQNYFELEDTAKGIVAAGPIAAYIVVVGLGIRAYKSISAKEPKLSDAERRLVGSTWEFDSRSRKGSERKGSFRVTSPAEGELKLEGNFETTDGTAAGDWDSTMVQCVDGRLRYVYDLTDTDDEGRERKSSGMISLHAKDKTGKVMSGKWVLMGGNDSSGEMTCRKVDG